MQRGVAAMPVWQPTHSYWGIYVLPHWCASTETLPYDSEIGLALEMLMMDPKYML